MQNTLFRKGVSLVLTLALTLSAGFTAKAAEADGLCEHHPSHTEDCGYAATGACTHQCSQDSGCITTPCSHAHVATCYSTAGELNCHHKCDNTPECQVPVIVCVHTQHGSCGHSEGQDCNYASSGCILCNAVEIQGTDVVLNEGTEYAYTGELIMPAVTVTVGGTVLTENQHYILTYANNIAVGTATAIITGVESAGYSGNVKIPFTIVEAPQAGEPTVPSEPTQPSEPTVPSEPSEPTVPSEPTTPSEPSEPTVPSEPTTPSEPSEPTVPSEPTTPSEPTEPSTPSEPTTPSEPSEPTEPSEPEEDKKPEYKITKGSGSKWSQDSGKDLRFDINADTADITGISIDGKKLDRSHVRLVDADTFALKAGWLEKQAIGTYRITVHFADGTASGTFTIAEAADIPQTGDTIGLWAGLLLTSLAGLGAAVLLLRKRASR